MCSPLHLFYLEDLILFACANSAPCLLCLPRSQLLCAPCLSVSVLIGPNFVLVLTSAPRLRVSAWRVQILSVVSAGGSQLLCAHCYITSFLCLSGLAQWLCLCSTMHLVCKCLPEGSNFLCLSGLAHWLYLCSTINKVVVNTVKKQCYCHFFLKIIVCFHSQTSNRNNSWVEKTTQLVGVSVQYRRNTEIQ